MSAMRSGVYLKDLNAHISHLYAFARQVNELDFAASLSGEFRGEQDAGWATTITADEVSNEINSLVKAKETLSKADLRVVLMLYCQLAEAGGFYETLMNMMGVVTLKPYLLWPFQPLVRVRNEPRRVIGPNANVTFRNLATTAKSIGLSKLSALLEVAFRDDIRNGISHADYIIWEDGLRLRNRNGGRASRVSFEDVGEAVTRGVRFFQLLREHNIASIRSFNPPKEIVGRFSVNIPMPWTVSFNPRTGAFGISGSSPGAVTTPEYQRQVEINGRLGGKVLALYITGQADLGSEVDAHILATGFDPVRVDMGGSQMEALVREVDELGLWDQRFSIGERSNMLLASPWGFRWLRSAADFDAILPKPVINLEFGQ